MVKVYSLDQLNQVIFFVPVIIKPLSPSPHFLSYKS